MTLPERDASPPDVPEHWESCPCSSGAREAACICEELDTAAREWEETHR